jgi:hypothetical protein
LSVEELVGRLKAAEDRFEAEAITDKARRLMLTEEDWVAKYHHRLLLESSSAGGGERQGGFNPAKLKGGERGDKEPIVKLTSEGTLRCKGRCCNCGIYGHWKQDCKRPKKERKEEAHHVQAEAEQPVLLLATVNAMHIKKVLRDVEPIDAHAT